MNLQDFPDWVRQNPNKYVERLRYEARELYAKFPHIGIYRNGDSMHLEGPVLTMSQNQYVLRIVYPPEYPAAKPEGYVRDADVIDFCSQDGRRGHAYHNYGNDPMNGLKLCVMDRDDSVNKGWTPNQTGISILEYAIMWLHAYEFKKARGYWPLPE